MGSGKYLNYAIKKHGLDKFTKEILFEFDNAKDMYSKEAEIVNDDFLSDENTYNLKRGGSGGFDYINSRGLAMNSEHGKLGAIRTNELRKSDPILDKKLKDVSAANLKAAHKAGLIKYDTFTGKNHSPESKKKIGEANSNNRGIKNSQFGTIWITNGIENKKIKSDLSIPDGWYKGRKFRGISSFGRATDLQFVGDQFETDILHQVITGPA